MLADADALGRRARSRATGSRSRSCSRSSSRAATARGAVVSRLHPHTGDAWSVGITGAPGAGKSTLTDALVACMRADGLEVGVLAVDPTARSAAARSSATACACRATRPTRACSSARWRRAVTSAGSRSRRRRRCGCSTRSARPWIVIETVGVGQVEVEIAGQADTTVVVVNPGWGDAVQAAKAGLLEIADVFVVNKADRPGRRRDRAATSRACSSCRAARRGGRRSCGRSRRPATGVDELCDAIARAPRIARGERRDRRRAAPGAPARRAARRSWPSSCSRAAATLCVGPRFDALVDEVARRARRDPYTAVDALLAEA